MKFILSVRGHFNYPTLVLIDVEEGKIVNKIKYKELFVDTIPSNKLGFTGIKRKGDTIWTATWDKLVQVSLTDFNIIQTIQNNQFSDLHGLYLSDKIIYTANTNLDAVFKVNLKNKKTEPFWFAWNLSKKIKSKLEQVYDVNGSYNLKTKKELPFHQFHLNSVHIHSKKMFISYLGVKKPKFDSIRKKIGINKTRYGGLVVLDHKKSIIKHFKCEGLHDAFEIDNQLAFTQYFSNSLFLINPVTLKKRIINLEMDNELKKSFLTRGGFQISENEIIVGHTLKSGWSMSQPYSLIRTYDLQGNFLNKQIKLDGVVGIYEFSDCN